MIFWHRTKGLPHTSEIIFWNCTKGLYIRDDILKVYKRFFFFFFFFLKVYKRACSSYECFIQRAVQLSTKLLGQGYVKQRLGSSLRKFYGRYGDLIKQYEIPLSRMLHDILDDDHLQWHPPLIRHCTNFLPFYWSGPYYRIWLFTELRMVSIEHLQRVRHANRGHFLLRTSDPVLFRTCICSTCWDQRHPVSIRHYTSLCHYYRTWHFYWFWHFTRYWFP